MQHTQQILTENGVYKWKGGDLLKNKQRKEWKRSGRMSQHHLKPSSRGGEGIGSNLLTLDSRKHEAWHLLFNNLTLEEIIDLLIRVMEMKNSLKRW